ncbi:MAG TPA: branched-chain amino acid ABC transporter substrate-binding protein [Actinomycetota bacterium]|nr:branched-chain amino acid ABC transporter substrate-binding protein [Actinomycetota bacterium]
MRRTRSFYLVALVAAFALLGAACGGGDNDTNAGGDNGGDTNCTWTIATMGALSGDYASVGQPIADGIEYAVEQANDAGDLQCELKFTSEDSQGDPNQAPALAQKIAGDDTVVFCACPYFSGETLATGDIFSSAGLAISGTGTNETIDEQGYTTWFRAVAPDNIQAEVDAQYIQAQGAKAVAVVHDNQDYSKGLAEGVIKNLGDAVVGGKAFVINPEETDYSAVISQIANANPDFVFFGGYTPQAGPLAKQLNEAGVDAQFMSDDGSKDPTFGGLAGPAAEGALVSCPCVDPLKIDAASDFVSGMQSEYGKNAPGTFAADEFDVTNIAIQALKDYSGDPNDNAAVRQAVVEAFQNADGAQGVAKAYSWTDDGEFEGGPEDIWIYQWSDKDKNFVSLGPAAELLK